ncbi:DUF4846 domain-containing protein [Pedobacter sp. MC2016-24]|uniref:DUF4846 domain-containing protein n=1 Tax=Pedobacter sp. MC2016-24 TaxID=2780090 RepID=UPI00187E771B|nr:DUF4846 domain-containing protein [Pedobacter sp. MC2016-24]MBE9598537.1 DUF4846 domain-containing protein [Pedobacter sp. MC2016-24]
MKNRPIVSALFLFSMLSFLLAPVFAQQSGNIPVPANFKRIKAEPGSFADWLRHIHLKKDKTVYLYNGAKKQNQQAQYAVLDISIGKRDLQQCADAVMRLYAEWRYSKKQYEKIAFTATDGTVMDYASWRKGYRFVLKKDRLIKVKSTSVSESRSAFDDYLQTVFTFAGTLSLSRELTPVANIAELRAGDVFLKGGSPGHAVLVMDLAVNAAGEKRFLLAQSYMPAQSIHILKNPKSRDPWYSDKFTNELVTPEWVFAGNSLYRWP